MFKKGQLFVNKDRDLVVVSRVFSQTVISVRNIYWGHTLTGTGVLNGYQLIGNNYKLTDTKMFKKGQLVRHEKTGKLFRVEWCGANLIVRAPAAHVQAKSKVAEETTLTDKK